MMRQFRSAFITSALLLALLQYIFTQMYLLEQTLIVSFILNYARLSLLCACSAIAACLLSSQ